MNLNVAGILIFLSVCGILSSNADRAIDCRKFVFAPLCRGVAAKRDAAGTEQRGQPVYLSDESFRYLLRSLSAGAASLGAAEEEHDKVGEGSSRREGESLGRMHQQNRYSRILRLLFENRSNSEKDNFPAQDLDSL